MPEFLKHNNSTETSVAKEVHHVKTLDGCGKGGGEEAGGNGSRWVVAFEAMAKW